MVPVLNYRIQGDYIISMLNNVYAIFLCLVFTYFVSFQFNQDAHSFQIRLMLTPENAYPVILLTAYFILDWLTATITVPLKQEMLYLLPLVLVGLILYLGVMIIFALDPKRLFHLYLLFGIYASVVP